MRFCKSHPKAYFSPISKQRVHRKAANAVMVVQVRAHLAVEHLISCNVVQLHSEKVIPGDGIKREVESVAGGQHRVSRAAG